jgi:hypothetical protein
MEIQRLNQHSGEFLGASQKITGPNRMPDSVIGLLISTAVHKSQKRLTLSPPTEFVAGIGRDELSEILGAAKIRKIGARQVILREGTRPTQLFLLKSGRAKFYRLTRSGGEVLLSLLAPGEVFGLSSLLAHPDRTSALRKPRTIPSYWCGSRHGFENSHRSILVWRKTL